MLNTRLGSTRPARRSHLRVVEPQDSRVACPRCGRLEARVIGRSESLPVVYLRCDGCRLASIAGA